jgi:DNA-binding NarL/FixJ family response regulator
VGNAQDSRRTVPIRVLLADDHRLYLETLDLILGLDDRVAIVGHAADGVEAVDLALKLRPDVVLLDVHMPRRDGIEAARLIRAALPAVPVVMLSSSSAEDDISRAREAGAASYLTKDAHGPAIVAELARLASQSSPPGARCAA